MSLYFQFYNVLLDHLLVDSFCSKEQMFVSLLQKQLLLEFALALDQPEGADHQSVVSEHYVHLVYVGLVVSLQHYEVSFPPCKPNSGLVLRARLNTFKNLWSKYSLVNFISRSREPSFNLFLTTYWTKRGKDYIPAELQWSRASPRR